MITMARDTIEMSGQIRGELVALTKACEWWERFTFLNVRILN